MGGLVAKWECGATHVVGPDLAAHDIIHGNHGDGCDRW